MHCRNSARLHPLIRLSMDVHQADNFLFQRVPAPTHGAALYSITFAMTLSTQITGLIKPLLPSVPRQAEKQNDFGGVLGGPIFIPGIYNGRDKSFFFFSYEGLRLIVPQAVQQYSVPDMTLRQKVPAVLQPYINAFPLPNAGEDGLNDGLGLINVAYSSPSSLDNFGLRVDHSFGAKIKVFGRFANTDSSLWNYYLPAIKQTNAVNIHTLTVGTTTSFTQKQTNELRFNYTQNNLNYTKTSTSFGGATSIQSEQSAGAEWGFSIAAWYRSAFPSLFRRLPGMEYWPEQQRAGAI